MFLATSESVFTVQVALLTFRQSDAARAAAIVAESCGRRPACKFALLAVRSGESGPNVFGLACERSYLIAKIYFNFSGALSISFFAIKGPIIVLLALKRKVGIVASPLETMKQLSKWH